MTAEEKTVLARFLDLTCDFLKDGHEKNRAAYIFMDDEPPSEEVSSLPLAYQIDEEEQGPEAESFGGENSGSLADLAAAIENCRACSLSAQRQRAVAGEGVGRPLVMIIGEGPGADDDDADQSFAGNSGQLLDRMLESIGLWRDKNCYITNLVKCRSSKNRDPEPDEIAACVPFLMGQIRLLRPLVILCAGRIAAQYLLDTKEGISTLRGKFTFFRQGAPGFSGDEDGPGEEAIPLLPTYHPNDLLKDESLKRPAWEDLKLLKAKLYSLSDEYARSSGEL